MKQGIAIILSSPSGAGKTTIEQMLTNNDSNFVSSISITTREKRPNEIDGKDYHFVSKNDFLELKQNNKLLEDELIFGHYYGTSRSQTAQVLKSGKNIIFVINWQGAINIISHLQHPTISFFILPPSLEVLKQRLLKRNTDNLKEIQKRLNHATFEISKQHLFHYTIINNDLSKCVNTIKSIVNKHNSIISV